MEYDGNKAGMMVSAWQKNKAIHQRDIAGRIFGSPAVLFLICLLLVFPLASVYGAQNKGEDVEYLVARRQIQDPYFKHSVVFMLPAPKSPLIVGLIINKPTRVTLGKLFPNTPEFKSRTEPTYFGGPVDVRIPSVVFRSPKAPEHAVQLYGNVYLTFDYDVISKVFENSHRASKPRMFLGRAQWSPGQLQNEIRRGGWYRVQAKGDLIFTSHPESLWRTLHDRAAPSKYIRYRIPSTSFETGAKKNAVM